MSDTNGLLSYNFTHYITAADLISQVDRVTGFTNANVVRCHFETKSEDKWRLQIHEWRNPTQVYLTLIGTDGIECSFNVKLSLMDENRQVKLEFVKKGWKFVGSQESFPIPIEMLKTITSGTSRLAAIHVAIVKIHFIQIPNPSGMAEELSTSFKSESFGDVKIECADGEIFYCHKGVLAAKSPVFAKMFNVEMKESVENRIRIEDFNSDVIAALLRFVYLGDWGDLSGVADRLYVAADKYQLDKLKLPCIAELLVNLNANSIVSNFRLAHLYGIAPLMAGCVDFLGSHKSEISAMDVVAEATKNE